MLFLLLHTSFTSASSCHGEVKTTCAELSKQSLFIFHEGNSLGSSESRCSLYDCLVLLFVHSIIMLLVKMGSGVLGKWMKRTQEKLPQTFRATEDQGAALPPTQHLRLHCLHLSLFLPNFIFLQSPSAENLYLLTLIVNSQSSCFHDHHLLTVTIFAKSVSLHSPFSHSLHIFTVTSFKTSPSFSSHPLTFTFHSHLYTNTTFPQSLPFLSLSSPHPLNHHLVAAKILIKSTRFHYQTRRARFQGPVAEMTNKTRVILALSKYPLVRPPPEQRG